ncbi:MAG: SPOR domain-containing protein [Nitrospirae bacterium]|nr:SPOR domain-containing protein [Nitrospirota bacterium]
MADKTIFVVDADQETDQRITSTLESEGYLVFSGVGHVVTDEMAGKLNPSLIFIRPLSANAAGFQSCRTIHTIPKLQNVPIVLLAALKDKVQPQYTEYYGIVDFLKPNFTSEELIAKTISVLASAQPPAELEEVTSLPVEVEETATFGELPAAEEPMVMNEPAAEQEPASVEEPIALKEPPAQQETAPKKAAATGHAEEEFPWEDEIQKPSPSREPLQRRAYRQRRVQRQTLLPWLLGLLVLVLLGGGGFVAYQYFMPSEKPVAREAKKAALPTAPEQKGAENAPSALPVTAAPATAPVTVSEPVAPAAIPAPAAPAQASASGQPVAAPKKPVYAVQAGAFKTEEIAAVMVKKLQAKGYEASARKGVTKDNSPIIRVLIGNFSIRKDAVKLAAEIQEKEKMKTTIFTN